MLSFTIQLSNTKAVQIKQRSYKNKISVIREGRRLRRKFDASAKLIIKQRLNKKWINILSE